MVLSQTEIGQAPPSSSSSLSSLQILRSPSSSSCFPLFRAMGLFDGLPVPKDKEYLRDDLENVDESWTVARFDSLPHVVHILTSKDRETEIQALKDQSDIVEEVVDEVVQTYHGGFNRAIQNYSQILRLFSESTQSIRTLKVDLGNAKRVIGARNKQLHQLWYRSMTLRHIISLLDQIENIAKVPARINKLIDDHQFYAAVQLHVQSARMLEREGLQTVTKASGINRMLLKTLDIREVGALQDVRSELTKLRGVLFYKVLEALHAHLYNTGEYSSATPSMDEKDDVIPTTTVAAFSMNNSQSLSRRTRLQKGDSHVGASGFASSVDGGSSYDGHDDDGTLDIQDGADNNGKDMKNIPRLPTWLSESTPDEFVETMRKSESLPHVKYLQTMVECLCMLGKVAAAGAIICQRLRPTIHEIITSKIKAQADYVNSSRPGVGQAARTATTGLHYVKGQLQSYQLPKQKQKNGTLLAGTLLAVSPVSPVMAPMGAAQSAAKELLDSILDAIVRIFDNHVVVGELLESKSSQQAPMNTPKSMVAEISGNPDSEASRDTGGYTIGFSMTVLQSECQQLICEILRATPEAASADAAVQTARLANKTPSKEKRQETININTCGCREDGLTFAFRFTDATLSVPSQGMQDCSLPLWLQGRNRKGQNVQEGYGSASLLPEQGIYLAASVYRPVLQFTDKIALMLPEKYSQLGNDGLLAFVENFVKDHFLPTMFVDYRKGVQQAISSNFVILLHGGANFQLGFFYVGPAAFRPRANPAAAYSPSVSKGRPVLQGLLTIDFLAKEACSFIFSFLFSLTRKCLGGLKQCQNFLAVLEKQSYMLIGRHDIDNLMRRHPASACLPTSLAQANADGHVTGTDAETDGIELEMSELLMKLRPIKQESLIRDNNKLILLASLSDSLEYIAESIERQDTFTLLTLPGPSSLPQSYGLIGSCVHKLKPAKVFGNASGKASDQVENDVKPTPFHHKRSSSLPPKDLASFAEDYRKLAIDCLKVLRVEMQLETVFDMQVMATREYLEDQDAEEPDDYVISLITQITRRDEVIAPFIAPQKRNYVFGGICGVASHASIKALSAIPSINSESVQTKLDHVRTYYELLNMPVEVLQSSESASAWSGSSRRCQS
ncbi:Sec8 exocyst complex component specific domain-containing protein [Cynara cardunculus var. scolymus]|uniref:Exocyst complex component Sec8 n=1 Tax=Cynara cardunculus var. scolymus TaxID=59895 RepID=A0A103YIF2_CYNCS|nr:Sec8 exocyst complex component specific domain-containing protein [Cynara cardunculus var. scolymus]